MTTDTTNAGIQFLRNVDEVLDGYIECLVWSGLDYSEEIDGNNPPLDEKYSADDVSDEARAVMRAECRDFVWHNLAGCLAYADRLGWASLGHDFALTRNHHGAGFFDRGLGHLGDRLQAAAQVYGEQNLWPTAEGRLEVE